MENSTSMLQDDSWRILKSLPARPGHTPRGFEFLPDAVSWIIDSKDRNSLERLRQSLAEADIVALFQTHLGHHMPVPQRIWRKYPLGRKVFPRFSDGKMRIGLHEHAGPHLVGWAFVRKGDVRKVLQGSTNRRFAGTDTVRFRRAELDRQYRAYVNERVARGERSSREQDRDALSRALGVVISHAEIRRARQKYAPDSWRQPGRRTTKSGGK